MSIRNPEYITNAMVEAKLNKLAGKPNDEALMRRHFLRVIETESLLFFPGN